MLRTVIIDDEKVALTHMATLVSGINGMTVVGEASSLVEGRELCARLSPELVILDIRMGDGSGLELGRELGERDCPPAVIYVSSSERYALEAFGANADGYLLKPVSIKAIEKAVRRACRFNQAHKVRHHSSGQRRFLTIKSRRGLSVLPIEEVRYFYADQKYVMAVTPDGERVLDDALRHLESEFSEDLLRVHRNALISIQHVTGLLRLQTGQFQVELDGVESGPIVSRRHLSAVRAKLSKM